MMRKFLLVSILFVAMSSFATHASAPEFALDATSAEDFRQQAQQLRSEMAAGGKYANLAPADQARVGKQLDRLQKLYDKRAAGGSVSNADQVALVNASEEINAALSGDEDQRMVCEQVRKLGSNRTEKVCLTVAQRKRRGKLPKPTCAIVAHSVQGQRALS